MSNTNAPNKLEDIAQSFIDQAGHCAALGSSLMPVLLEAAARDIKDGGIAASLMAEWEGHPVMGALPLRFSGALHHLVLTGHGGELNLFYPTAPDGSYKGNSGDADILWPAVCNVIKEQEETVRAFLSHPPQTNEVRRSAVLLGGFLKIAEAYSLPLQLFEIGASAGLNLNWDKFFYSINHEDGTKVSWGDETNPLTLPIDWHGPLPPLDAPLHIAGRYGCDVKPVDLSDDETVRHLEAFIWPDQPDRLVRLRNAISIARTNDTHVEEADATSWVAQMVSPEKPSKVRVLYHSIMWSYLPETSQNAIRNALEEAGSRADKNTPLAWLRMEHPGPDLNKPPELTLTLWPERQTQRLAVAHPHGASLRWFSSPRGAVA
ncbi:MAG: DUF2332 domain-containing protein [Parvularculales bacterium]